MRYKRYGVQYKSFPCFMSTIYIEYPVFTNEAVVSRGMAV